MNVTLLQWACLLAAIWNTIIAIFVFTRNVNKLPNRVFLLLGLAIAIWNTGTFFMFHVDDAEAALWWARFLNVGVLLLPAPLIHLSILIAELRWRWAVLPLYIVTSVLAALSFTDLYIASVVDLGYAFYSQAGIGFWLYSPLYVSLIIASIIILVNRRSKLPVFKKRKLDSLIIGQSVLVFFGINDLLPILGFYTYPLTDWVIYPWGTLAAVLYGTIIAYSLLQHQLLDVHVRLGKMSAQIVRMVFLMIAIMVSFSVASMLFPESLTLSSIGVSFCVLMLSLILVSFLFPKIIGATGEQLERTILGDHFEYHDRLRAFAQSLQMYTNTDNVVQDIQSLLINTMQVKSFVLFLADESLGSFFPFCFYPSNPSRPLPMIEMDDPLLLYLEKNRLNHFAVNRDYKSRSDGFQFNNFDECAEFAPEFCFSIRSAKKPFGLLFIGKKEDGLPYTAQDVELIGQMTRSAALVINQIRLTRKVDLQHEQELIGVMSRGLAHDLNNLFTPIKTYFQLAQEGKRRDGGGEDQLFDIAIKNIETIQAYIRESLLFATTLKPDFAHAALMAIVEESYRGCRTKLDEKGISVRVDFPHAFPLHADAILLQRLFTNLITNAADASPRNSSIEIIGTVLARTGGKDRWYRVSVVDSGSGIPRDLLKKVFTPYFTTKDFGDEGRGLGLGLSICRRIAEIHEGTIRIHSKEGRGTTVEVDLPIREGRHNASLTREQLVSG